MGSHWQSVVTLERPLTDPRARYRVIAHTMPSRWQAVRIAWSAGLFLDWFVRAFATADGRGCAPSDGHARLATDAASIPPGAGGIVAVGGLPLTGPDWTHAAPSLLGFSLGDAERARPSAYRAIVEAGCLTVAANLDVIADGTRSAEAEGSEMHVAGGAGRSDLACGPRRMTGHVVVRADTPQASTVGAAACAASQPAGTPTSSRRPRRWPASIADSSPDPAAHDAYLGGATLARGCRCPGGVGGGRIAAPVWKPAS